MIGVGFILFMIGASGITDPHGNLQVIPIAMVAVGIGLIFISQKRRERRKCKR